MSELRILGVACGTAMLLFAVLRRRSRAMTRGEALLTALAGLTLMAVSFYPPLINGAIERTGTRLMALAILGNLALFGLVLYLMQAVSGVRQELGELVRALARSEYERSHGGESRSGGVAVVIPAYNEEDNIGAVLPRIPATVCGVETAVLVVDDGSRDRTGDIARTHGAAVARHVINRGGGAALRTGYRLTSDSEASVVVTLDADGQHLPEEMSRLVGPVLDGEIDVAHGSRVLGHAAPNHYAREMGIVFFNRLVSFITRTKVSDCSNGYRAVRASVLPQLVLRQEQFHTSEFMIEAIKRGVPAREIPVTVVERLHGHSKKPAVIRYGLGFANAIVRTWLR
jgi:hypothetical protein